ncbi:MAG: 1-acyl-sn-glycerol-3-phosphate acyltransferase [Marmoricola sp.]|nr:1-acyl-sn-glycerol-3-phosphate acyltransferase [Marmoricola sp.]
MTTTPVKSTETGHGTRPSNPVASFIASRVDKAQENTGSDTVLKVQAPLWRLLNDYYFRTEVTGWENLPDTPSMLIGVHAGATLTLDTWTLQTRWWERFGAERRMHIAAHDVLLALPGLGDYFRSVGCIPANRRAVTSTLAAGDDVAIYPGGEQDAMRNWRRRDEVVLAGRKGFIRQALRSGVPIVPVATSGGSDTVFVLSEGRWLADALDKVFGLKDTLRGVTVPIIAGFPFPLAVELLPAHLPLPAKIRTRLLEPIELDDDPERANDKQYVQKIYDEVEHVLQQGVTDLARRRRFPLFF